MPRIDLVRNFRSKFYRAKASAETYKRQSSIKGLIDDEGTDWPVKECSSYSRMRVHQLAEDFINFKYNGNRLRTFIYSCRQRGIWLSHMSEIKPLGE